GYAALEMLTGDGFAALFGLGQDASWLAWHADPARRLDDWRTSLFRVPEGLLDVIAGLIEKDTACRPYRTAAHLHAALERSRLPSLGPKVARTPRGARPAGKLPALVVLSGSGSEPRRFAPGRPAFVGRARDCELRLEAPEVAAKHALLCTAEGRWWVHDLGA